MTLELHLPPELEQRLIQEANRQGVTIAAVALRLIEEHFVPSDEEFKKAAEHVLQKNSRLYTRLSDHVDVCFKRK